MKYTYWCPYACYRYHYLFYKSGGQQHSWLYNTCPRQYKAGHPISQLCYKKTTTHITWSVYLTSGLVMRWSDSDKRRATRWHGCRNTPRPSGWVVMFSKFDHVDFVVSATSHVWFEAYSHLTVITHNSGIVTLSSRGQLRGQLCHKHPVLLVPHAMKTCPRVMECEALKSYLHVGWLVSRYLCSTVDFKCKVKQVRVSLLLDHYVD